MQGDGSRITVEPGLIGGEVNKILENHHKASGTSTQYKIGPDPSSIDSCMIGGIVANNSSGMCCGVSQNTYHTLKDLRVVFADGTVLDTAVPESRDEFLRTHADLAASVSQLAERVQVQAAPICAVRPTAFLMLPSHCLHWRRPDRQSRLRSLHVQQYLLAGGRSHCIARLRWPGWVVVTIPLAHSPLCLASPYHPATSHMPLPTQPQFQACADRAPCIRLRLVTLDRPGLVVA